MPQPWEQDWNAKPATNDASAPPWARDWAHPAPEDNSGNLSRGLKVSLGEVAPIAKGAVGLVGATGEQAFGEGGIWTGIKNWGLRGYQEGMGKLQPLHRDTDSLTEAWGRAKEGDLGALVDWAEYGLGYGLGQLGEAAAMSVIGGVAGAAAGGAVGAGAGAAAGAVAKGGVKAVARGMIEKAVAKEAGVLAAAAEKQGIALTAEQATAQATKNVTREIGSTLALGAYGVEQEAGSIYADAEEEATKQGRKLDGGDIARIWGASLAAGGVEALTDKLNLGAVKGKVQLPGAGGMAARAVAGGVVTGAGEALTEAAQTAIERYGAGKELTGDEATKDYIDSAGLGFSGGLIPGAVGGARGAKPRVDPNAQLGAATEDLKNARDVTSMIDAAEKMATRPSDDIVETMSGLAEGTRRGLQEESMRTVSEGVDKAIADAEKQAQDVGPPKPLPLETDDQALRRTEAERAAAAEQYAAGDKSESLTDAQARVERERAAVAAPTFEGPAAPSSSQEPIGQAAVRIWGDRERAAEGLRQPTIGERVEKTLDMHEETGGGERLRDLQRRIDLQTAPAPVSPSEADRQSAQEQARVGVESMPHRTMSARDTYPGGLDPLTRQQAEARLTELRRDWVREGRDPDNLTVQRHPTVPVMTGGNMRQPAFIVHAAPERVADMSTVAPEDGLAPKATPFDAQRVEQAAVQGDFNAARQDLPAQMEQQGFKRAQQAVEERGGLATPEEAAILDKASPNERLYDRIEGEPATTEAKIPDAEREGKDAARTDLALQRLGIAEQPAQPRNVKIEVDDGIRSRDPERAGRLEHARGPVEAKNLGPQDLATTAPGAAAARAEEGLSAEGLHDTGGLQLQPKEVSDADLERYNGRKVRYQVRVEDTGEVAEVSVDAKQAAKDLRERRDVMRNLIKCLER